MEGIFVKIFKMYYKFKKCNKNWERFYYELD